MTGMYRCVAEVLHSSTGMPVSSVHFFVSVGAQAAATYTSVVEVPHLCTTLLELFHKQYRVLYMCCTRGVAPSF